jgi:DNA-binding transcriptional MocR family regulator
MYRYLQLAVELEEKINTGVYRAGQRLPSLRELHTRTGFSITTINQAYLELERRGLVEPRRKSGYYVRPLLKNLLPLPQTAPRVLGRPCKVKVDSLAESILSIIHDENVVPFGAALPAKELLPTKQLAKSMKHICDRYFKGGGISCGPPDGLPELKRQIVGRAIGYGRYIDENDIIITYGCMDAIQLCLRALTRPGEIVVTESPTFTCYLQLIRDLGLLALEIPTDPKTGIDLDSLEKSLQYNRVAACLLNPTFQNPLGFEMPVERKERLVKMLENHGIPIIEDDIFGELYYGGTRPLPLKAFDTSGLVLYCSSFSKTLAPDFRVGWIVPGRFKEQIDRLKFNSYIVPSKLTQLVITDFLNNGHFDRHLRKLRNSLMNQVSSTVQAIARHFPKGTKLTTPAGGYILWVELDRKIDGTELFNLAWQKKILILPGAIATSTGRSKNCIRISCGHPFTDRMEKGIEMLGQLISDLAA